jgi:hypothetical protein
MTLSTDHQAAREVARVAGVRLFEGDPCRVCQGTRRYVSSGGCAACMQARALAQAKPYGGRAYRIDNPWD